MPRNSNEKTSIVQSLSDKSWRRFVDEHPDGNIFHTPEMFQVFRRVPGHRPELWAATRNEDGRVLALLLPVQVTVVGSPLRFFTTRAVVYGGLLHAPDEEGRDALSHLLRVYARRVEGHPLFTELRNLSDTQAVQPILRQHGFVYEEHLNYLIDLACPPEAILQSIGKRTRKNIRRGLRKGQVVVVEAREQEQVADCYTLLSKTYQAAQVPLADSDLFKAAFDLLLPKGMARFSLAYVEGKSVAASVELLYKETVYGWYGGVDRAYSSYMPNELLMWDILRWGAESGYRVYDFGGAGKPDEEYGVRDFKAKFGGELVCFGRNTLVHAPARLRLSEWGYSIYRRLL